MCEIVHCQASRLNGEDVFRQVSLTSREAERERDAFRAALRDIADWHWAPTPHSGPQMKSFAREALEGGR